MLDASVEACAAYGSAANCELGLAAIRQAGWAPDLVGGLTLGADPVAYAIAAASARRPPIMDGFTVRKEPKDHGIGRRIEGPFRGGSAVVAVEDVITTGGSALKAIEAIHAERGRVLGVLAVVDREEGGREAIEAAGYRVTALVPLSDLIG